MMFKILKTSLTAEIQILISCDCVPGSETVRVVVFFLLRASVWMVAGAVLKTKESGNSN